MFLESFMPMLYHSLWYLIIGTVLMVVIGIPLIMNKILRDEVEK